MQVTIKQFQMNMYKYLKELPLEITVNGKVKYIVVIPEVGSRIHGSSLYAFKKKETNKKPIANIGINPNDWEPAPSLAKDHFTRKKK